MLHLKSFLRPPLYLFLLVLALPITVREVTAANLLDCESQCSHMSAIVYREALDDGHTPTGARAIARRAYNRCRKSCGPE